MADNRPRLVPLASLRANPNNPRVLRDEKFAKLKQSLLDFPDMLNYRPLVVTTAPEDDSMFVVLGGNMRLRALQELKINTVPVMVADHWNKEQRAEFIIKDNLSFGEWDWEQLAEEWNTQDLADWGLDIPGATATAGETDPFADEGIAAKSQYGVIVHCKDETEQAKVFSKLVSDGHECKVVVT